MEVTYSSDSCSDSDAREIRTLNFAYKRLQDQELELKLDEVEDKDVRAIETVLANNNSLTQLPSVARFCNLKILDISFNNLTRIPEEILQCPLTTLIAKNNKLSNDSLPKSLLSKNGNFREINLSGNIFSEFPEQILELKYLKYVYFGGNRISTIPKEIRQMTSLQVLSLPGNRIESVPDTVGSLHQLQALILYDNAIEQIPASIANLSNLKSLYLHNNKLKHLPRDIITLKNLYELSLRDNPLVVRFVKDMTLSPPSLLELSARVLKGNDFSPTAEDVPSSLLEYLNSANCCVNPQCKGVFFDNRVEHIKFVDFCGKYRVPLMQYLCSSKCITKDERRGSRADRDFGEGASGYMMRKVLLG